MKAMVFAAGIGSRLKHLTQNSPKCLVPVGDSTMLELVVTRLKEVGVTDIMVNLHHLPHMIRDYVTAKDSFGVNVHFSMEEDLLDTGGGLKKAMGFFANESEFFVHNSDIYSNIDLNALLDAHRTSSAVATLAVMSRESKRGLFFDDANQLVGWTGEKIPAPQNARLLAFSGIQVVKPTIFDFMGSEDVFSIIEPYLKAARAGHRVWGYSVNNSYWLDMGTPDDLDELRKRFQ